MYFIIEELRVFSPCFFNIHSKQSWVYDTKYDTSGNSNSSFQVGIDILNLFF